jgi:uncharacterized sulfatase
MKRKTLAITSTVVILALIVITIAYSQRVTLMVSAVGYAFKWQKSIGENQPITWDTGTADTPIDGERPPNIIVIMTDDMGFNDVSFYGGGMIETPNIDQLGKQGVSFENGYAGNSVCAPSRAMLMTGKYATRFGFEFTPTPDPMETIFKILAAQDENPQKINFLDVEASHLSFDQRGLPSREVTIAEALKELDYHTVHIGKWHLGRTEGLTPNAQGFDESLLMASGLYLPEDSPDVVNSKQEFDMIDQVLWSILDYAASFNNGEQFKPEGYLTDYYTKEAVKVIEANKDRPFFMYLAHWGVHTPLQALKSDYDALAEEIPDHRQRVYAAMIRALDRSVGEVLQALQDNGVDENTLIIFTSDNGGANYVGLPDINKPFRGWKLTFFEGGTHVPFFMRWPGVLPAGKTYPHPISHLDVFSTALAAATAATKTQIETDDLDGINLLPFIKGDINTAPDRAIFWKEGHYQAVLSDGWKLHRSANPEKIRLFNLTMDRTEQSDLAASHPQKVKELEALLDAHIRTQAEPLWGPAVELPIWIDKPLGVELTKDDDYIYFPN